MPNTQSRNGAFKSSTNGYDGAKSDPNGGVKFYATINFDANGSNSVYGNSSTVQPKSMRILYVIKY